MSQYVSETPTRTVPLVVALTVAVVALAAAGCGGANTPVAPADETSLAVSFKTEDGVELNGRLFGRHNTGVLLAHMFPADQTSWWDFAEVLAEQGYMALAFDFRGYRDSGGGKDIEFIDRDVRAAVAFLREQGATDVFLVGASMGATASIKVASENGVAGVVSLSGPLEFRGLSVKGVRVRVPALLMAAADDRSAVTSVEEMISLGIVGGPDLAQSVVYEETSAHGTRLIDPGAETEMAVKESILEFVRTNSE